MSRLLYIEASPRKKRSTSIEIAHDFLRLYEESHPHDEVKTIDLWKENLPAFDGDVIDAKYAIMHQQAHSEPERKAWRAVVEIIDEFKLADKYVFSLPMWNFSIPYKLKHYFDLIVQPGYTFSSSPQGYEGLVTNKPVLVIYSRGGAYGLETGGVMLDLQKAYMETVLKFIGFDKIESIIIEPTLASQVDKELTMKDAKEKAKVLAASF